MRAAQTDDHLSRIQYADIKTYLAGDILTKVDRASMANSLEVRVPLLDHLLVEWSAGLPSRLKLRNGVGKYVLKRALEKALPRSTLYRSKMGFEVPLANWLRGPLRSRVRDLINRSCVAQSGIFDMNFLSQLVGQHESGVRNHSVILWAIMMFDCFLLQSERHAAPPEQRDVAGDRPMLPLVN